MVALVHRIRKLEKKAADRSQTGHLDDRVVYQPTEDELAEAVAILVECRAAVCARDALWRGNFPDTVIPKVGDINVSC